MTNELPQRNDLIKLSQSNREFGLRLPEIFSTDDETFILISLLRLTVNSTQFKINASIVAVTIKQIWPLALIKFLKTSTYQRIERNNLNYS